MASHVDQIFQRFRLFTLRKRKCTFLSHPIIGIISHIFAQKFQAFLAALHTQPEGNVFSQ